MNIVNTFDQLMAARTEGLPDVAIILETAPSSSRSKPTFSVGWAIWRPRKALRDQQNIRWYEHADHLPFRFSDFPDADEMPRGSGARIAAMAAAHNRYGVTEWKRNAMGQYVDARVDKLYPLPKRERKKVTS